MRSFSRIAVLGGVVMALAVGGSPLATAKGHGHATLADVIRDVKDTQKDVTDAKKDAASAQNDVNTPDSAAVAQQEQVDAQNERADNRSETQDGRQEGDDPGQASACKGLLTDNVQYDSQTGTCTAESGQDNDSTGDTQDNNHNG